MCKNLFQVSTMSVLIVGCGVFGLSTALELAKKGYEVTAIDAYPIPSPWSAANDYNKIIRTEYDDMVYTKLSVEALELWRNDPLYSSAYNECGRILVTPESNEGRKLYEANGIKNLKSIPGHGKQIQYILGGKALSEKFDYFRDNNVSEQTEVKWNPESGVGYAAKSLIAVYKAAKKLGVKFYFGDKGKATKIVSSEGLDYVLTEDGTQFTADKIVVALGASTGRLVDLRHQQSASCLFVTHVCLSEDEFQRYKDMPVVFDSVLGYFFPPDTETRKLKVALPGAGAQNLMSTSFGDEKRSLPQYKTHYPKHTIPVEGIEQARTLLREYIPELAYHKLVDHKTCWIADTADSHYIIDKVPYLSNVWVATGDSGHAYKLLPNIGSYVVERLEDSLEPHLSEIWRWREDVKPFDAHSSAWKAAKAQVMLESVKWVKAPSDEKSDEKALL